MNQRRMKVLFHLLIIFLFVSCNNENQKDRASTDTVKMSYAESLSIQQLAEGTRVVITDPDNRNQWKFILHPTQPIHKNNDEVWIKTPIQSIIALSGTDIGMLSKLDGVSLIKGVANSKYIFSKELKKFVKLGKVSSFGGDESVSFEKIVQCKSSVLTYSCFGKEFPHTDQLQQAGTICIPVFDWKEVHPLGKAEWIKLYGCLTGKTEQAESYFESIETDYQRLVKLSNNYSKKPSVLSGNMTGDIWFCPAGESYFAKLIRDAGANYKYQSTKGTGSLSLSLEKITSENKEAAFWINPGIAKITDLISSNPKASFFSAYKKRSIYCYSANMNKYWELAAIEPNHVLSDLIHIFHPDLKTKHPLYFYAQLN
jgi:iron complex transport system substrate-binding protein